jgi:carbonic anhydrase
LSYLNEILSLKRGPNYLSYTLRRGFKPAILSINGQEYSLKNIHFHTPSEHTIDGVRFPAEVHFVHEAIGPATSAKAGGKKKYAVMGIFLDDGGLSSNFDNLLGSLLSDEAPIRKQGEPDEIAALGVDTSVLQSFDFKQEYLGSGEVFYYPGSLTTPPYSSDVSWMVVPKPVSVKSPLMKGMTALGVDNARPVQTSVANSEVLKLVRSN